MFCRVVDNYGDIGVCWRLARQLVAEHNLQVRLWVDDLQVFARLCPGLDTGAATQHVHGLEICRWDEAWPETEPADVVIEAFACFLPAAYISAMERRERPCLWLNLEYLSAEAWVDGCHGLPSLQSNGLSKYFFFPGFSAHTGGLLREVNLLTQRDQFQHSTQAQQAFLAMLGVARQDGERLISLFAYEIHGITDWLHALSVAEQPTHLLVTPGKSTAAINKWLRAEPLQRGESCQRGALKIQVLPFLSHDDYDHLLWACDFNVVRGEDSFVRAQWAAKPFLWHIYPQDEDTHLQKLQAFLTRYTAGLAPQTALRISALWQDWNRGANPVLNWRKQEQDWPELLGHAQAWSRKLAVQPDIATALVEFHRNWV